jgi:nucleotide-binding universal stress UspA family protein
MRALDHALKWAETRPGVELVLVNVQPHVIEWQVRGMGADAIKAHQDFQANEALKEAIAATEARRVRYRVAKRSGEPAEQIVDVARTEAVNGIVLGTRGLGKVADLFLGSVAHKVVHLASVPVTLVK